MYDGYTFHNYPYAKENELIGHVNVIKPDAGNRIWIGSGAGLFCCINNEIRKISATSTLPQGINDILLAKNGKIWLATENGAARFDTISLDLTGKKKITIADHLLSEWSLKNEVIDKRRTNLICEAPDGAVYITQYQDLFRFWNNRLELVHSAENSRDKILSLFPLSASAIYFDRVSTEMNKLENGILNSYAPTALLKPGLPYTQPGIWYVGTRGAFCFHPETGTISTAISFSDKYMVWAKAILNDNDFLWVASTDGLIKLKPAIFTVSPISTASTYNDYYSVTGLKNGKLLMGANRGMLFEQKAGSFGLIKTGLVPSAELKCIYEDEQGWLWIGSGYQGLVLIRNGKSERYTIENGLHDNSLYQFLKTRDGRLYVCGDQGLSEIIVDKNNTVSFRKFLFEPNITQYAKFYSCIEAPDGTVWTGGEEGLLYLHHDTLKRFNFNGKQLAINHMLKDKAGDMWIATAGEGILQCRFNNKNEPEITKEYTEKDGLNTLHYLTLLADNENNIWAGSSQGISVIGRQGLFSGRVLNFDEPDGFIKSGYSYISLYQHTDSSIWAASSLGFISFKPQQLIGGDAAPLVYITGVRPLKQNELIASAAFYEYPPTSTFSYSDNSFNFNFTALDYANQENIRYYYKLDGLDSNWKNAGSLRSISFENLSPGHYTFRVKALNSKGRWSTADAVYTFTVTPPFWLRWWFISALALLVTGAVLYLFKRKSKAAALNLQAKEKELEVIKLNHDLAASKLTVLRTQMNPHFIFNALNSVQQYILQGNVVEANKYLSKFSKLQREILHYSNHNFISLEKEIELLHSYLELEQLRFGEGFTYEIYTTEEIDPAEIKIPPMMLQPFAENAIWHGLMPKQGEKKLILRFSLFADDTLLATITDNGIGREASAKLKLNNGKSLLQHESKGMQMIHQRLQLLQQQYDKPFEVAVSDITDKDGLIQGTQVALKIFIGN